MVNILIAEDIPSHNKGEEALLLGLIESLKNIPERQFKMLSLNPAYDAQNYAGLVEILDARGITPAHMIDSQATTLQKTLNILLCWFRYSLFALVFKITGEKNSTKIMNNPVWKAYCEADLVLMAHDSFYSPRYHSTIALFCCALNKPLAIYAGTAEHRLFHPQDGKMGNFNKLLRYTMSKVPLILLREKFSYDNFLRIGLASNKQVIEVHTDLAFAVKANSAESARKILRKEGVPRDQPLVGLTMSRRQTQHAYPNLPLQERTEKSLDAIVRAVDHITEHFGANIVFIPHSIGPSDYLDDRILADMIIARAKHPERLFNIRTEYSVRDLKALAGELDLAIGARLHFIVDAVCNFVPSLLITHEGEARCHGIIGQMLGLEKWVYNIDRITPEDFIQLVQELWDTKDEVRSYLREKVPPMQADVYNHGKRARELLDRTKAVSSAPQI